MFIKGSGWELCCFLMEKAVDVLIDKNPGTRSFFYAVSPSLESMHIVEIKRDIGNIYTVFRHLRIFYLATLRRILVVSMDSRTPA